MISCDSISKLLQTGVITLLGLGTIPAEEPATAAAIGRAIFQDTNLSRPKGQACISCHDPNHAFADSRQVSPGAAPSIKGTRNAPSLMYAALIPPMAFDDFILPNGSEAYAWEGGLFHDGRAQDLFEQVQEPFFNPREMNLPGPDALAEALRKSSYAPGFQKWIGNKAWKNDEQLNYFAYRSLVEFLKEPFFRPFDSRFDAYQGGEKNILTKTEKRGLKIFKTTAACADCHFLHAKSWTAPLLSDFGYDNLGVPSLGQKDPGLFAVTDDPEDMGKFKAPSLRNIALTAPYMHNGSIPTLREVLEFYNVRDLQPPRWPKTDYPKTVNHDDMGDLGLSEQEIDELLAFLKTLSDRSLLKKPKGQLFPNAPAGTPGTLDRKLHFPDWTHRLHPAFPGK